jgi:Predicted Rossmann fold nucleotide-binding protein involved in DNA uptake
VKRVEEIGNPKYLEMADREIEFCAIHGIKIITRLDEDYPTLLNQCVDAPIVLFTKGNAIADQSTKIAIVGTRKMTNYGRHFITNLLEDLKDYDVSIISGLAYGCDIEAHKNALKIITYLGNFSASSQSYLSLSTSENCRRNVRKRGLDFRATLD